MSAIWSAFTKGTGRLTKSIIHLSNWLSYFTSTFHPHHPHPRHHPQHHPHHHHHEISFGDFPWKKNGEQFNMTGTIGTLRTEVQLLVFRWFLAPRCSRNRPNTLKYRGLLEDTRTFSMRIYVESWNLDITQANAPSKSIQIEGSTNHTF